MIRHTQLLYEPQDRWTQSGPTRVPDLPERGRSTSTKISVEKQKPWERFSQIIEEKQPDDWTTVVFNALAITSSVKQFRADMIVKERYDIIRHQNILEIRHIFQHEEIGYFVYEYQPVALCELISCAMREITEPCAAEVIKQTLEGIAAIHKDLNISHGTISTETVLVSRGGIIKISDIGRALLSTPQGFEGDIKAIAQLVIAMLSPAAALMRSMNIISSFGLDAGEDCREFTKKAFEETPIKVLQEHAYIKLGPGPVQLVPYVCVAERSTRRKWKFPEKYGS